MPQSITLGADNQIFFHCVEDCFEPIMLTDQAGRMTYVNPAWVMTYGYQKSEAIGQTPRLLRSVQQSSEFYKAMWQTILDPAVGFWKGEVMNCAKDGHLVPVHLTITPYRNATGDILGYMGIAVDLTEQKKMEEQILHQDRLASVGMLAGGLAHEIGNPLGVIRGRAELVLNQVRGNENLERNFEVILSQIDRISGLIRSLLTVSRAPDKILLREVALQPAVEEVLSLITETCRGAGIELLFRDLGYTIFADPGHLQQLFLNLVINSMHAIEEQSLKSEPGSMSKKVIVICAERTGDKQCVVSITDTGCGISAGNLRRLFQPFFTTKAAGKGTGLGLAIVNKLVDEMGGKITVESEGVGKGATFKLQFKMP